MYYIRCRNTATKPGTRQSRDAAETITAAPRGIRLTWKNSGLNTGAQLAPLGSRRDDTTHNEPPGSVDGQFQSQDDDQEGRSQGRPQDRHERQWIRPRDAQLQENDGKSGR